MKNNITSIFLRYIAVILLGLFELKLIYSIFKPLTTKLTFEILNLYSYPQLLGNIILLNGQQFEIINACVIGSAYYLLFILFMSFQKIDLKKRTYAIISSSGLLLIANISRIIFLISIHKNLYFEQIHWVFWNIISTIFVIAIFLITIKIYKIKETPFLEDIKLLWKISHPSKKNKSSHKRKKRSN